MDRAGDYETASRKIRDHIYDLAILDIMGVNGLQLLEETVAKGIPTHGHVDRPCRQSGNPDVFHP